MINIGFKLIIIVGLAIFLTLIGITGGAFLDVLLPNSHEVIGHALCWVGGFVTNPIFYLGEMAVPYPVFDDIAIGLFAALPLTFMFLKKKSWKGILIGFFSFFAIFIIIYKVLGLYMIYIAEESYGMTGCLEAISIGGQEIIKYEWYSPLFLIGFVLAIIALMGGLYKIWKWKNSQGGSA